MLLGKLFITWALKVEKWLNLHRFSVFISNKIDRMFIPGWYKWS